LRTTAAIAAALLTLTTATASAAVQPQEQPPLVRDAIYSWWVHPLAVGDGDDVWLSTVNRRGGNELHRITPSGTDRVLLPGQPQADDHNAAAVWLDPGALRLLAAGSRHNEDTYVRLWTVHRGTLTVDGPQQLEMGGLVSYAQFLAYGDTLHLLCRRGQDQWVYRTSDDGGLTWQPPRVLLDGDGLGQVYLTTRPDPANPALVHFATVGNPAQVGLPDVGYGRIRLDTGAVTTLDGTTLGNMGTGPSVGPDELDQAVVPSGTFRVRLLDVGVIGGRPAIAYTVWNTADSNYPPNYKIKRWTGSAWLSGSWSLPAGATFGFTAGAHYHGGLAIGDDGTWWTSRKDDGSWLVEAWHADGSPAGEVASAATRLIRPYAVRGGGWVYQDTLYEHFTRYYGDLVVTEG
jgi:hypothetical protein